MSKCRRGRVCGMMISRDFLISIITSLCWSYIQYSKFNVWQTNSNKKTSPLCLTDVNTDISMVTFYSLLKHTNLWFQPMDAFKCKQQASSGTSSPSSQLIHNSQIHLSQAHSPLCTLTSHYNYEEGMTACAVYSAYLLTSYFKGKSKIKYSIYYWVENMK